MIERLSGYKTISIIGIAKNVGKTTTLNYLLNEYYGKKKVGLTSIGRDGETIDVVTNTPKPQIYIEQGTIVATAKGCLKTSDFTKRVLETTPINTPLGEVVIVEALSDGFVDLAGPSYNAGMKQVITLFEHYGVEVTLIDGAISKKGLADHFISDATILCTGASYSSNIEECIKETKNYVSSLTLPTVSSESHSFFKKLMETGSVHLVNRKGEVYTYNLKTALHASKEICEYLSMESQFLVINGAFTNELGEQLLSTRGSHKNLQIILKDGSKCFCEEEILNRLSKSGSRLFVLENTKLICLTYNPTSPYTYFFEDSLFRKRLEHAFHLPIYNVMRINL